MSSEPQSCPECGERIKESVFGSNPVLPEDKLAVINEYSEKKSALRCTKCGEPLYERCRDLLTQERERLYATIQRSLARIPVVSLQAPQGWDYVALGLVTAQSTTGTGVFSEFAASLTDIFGAQSRAYNQKLKAGEDLCKSILRREALNAGGNAVLAVDIDYAEVGGDKGMLMVCMTGTAVRLRDPSILGEQAAQRLTELHQAHERLNLLFRFRDISVYA